MSYPYVSDDELRYFSTRLVESGFHGEELDAKLAEAALDLDTQRSQQSSTPMFAKAAQVSAPNLLASLLRGGPAWTPGDNFMDKLSRAGAGKLENMVGQGRQQDVAQATAGPMWPLTDPEAQKTWAAFGGQQAPLAGMSMGLDLAGGAVGGVVAPLAAVGAGAAIPAPEEAATIPLALALGPKIGSLLFNFVGFTAMEGGGWMKATDGVLDRTVAEKYSRIYGPLSGAAETVQEAVMLSPMLKNAKRMVKGAPPVGSRTQRKLIFTLLRKAGLEGIANFGEGVTELSQAALFNAVLTKAVEEQNQINAQRGEANVDPDILEQLKEDTGKNFAAGLGISMMYRGAGHTLGAGVQAGRITKAITTNAKASRLSEKAANEQVIEKFQSLAQIVGQELPDAPSGKALGTAQTQREAARPLTQTEVLNRLDNFRTVEELTPIATALGINVSLGAGKGFKSAQQLQGEVKAAAGLIKEGVRVVQRPSPTAKEDMTFNGKPYKKGQMLPLTGVEVVPPTINPAMQGEKKYGQKVYQTLRSLTSATPSNEAQWFKKLQTVMARKGKGTKNQLLKEGRELGISETDMDAALVNIEENPKAPKPLPNNPLFVPVDQQSEAIRTVKTKALTLAVGEQIAKFLVQDDTTSIGKQDNLTEVLSRPQYQAYVKELEGLLRGTAKTAEAQDMLANLRVTIDATTHLKPIPIGDIGALNVTQVLTDDNPDSKRTNIPWLLRFSAMVPALESLSQRLNLRLTGMDDALFTGHKMEQGALRTLSLARNYYWRQIPKDLRYGMVGKKMAELVHFLSVDTKNQSALASQLGVGKTNEAFINRVIQSGSKLKSHEILAHAEFLARNDRKMYDWFVANGAVDPRQYLAKYVPIIRVYAKNSQSMTFEQWINENRNKREDLKKLNDTEVEQLVDITDTLAGLKEKKLPIPGAANPFMRFARAIDNEFIQDLGRITDSRELMDIYMRKAVRKMIFGHMVPAVSEMLAQANDANLSNIDRKTVNIILGNYLESMMGVPDQGTMALQKVNIMSMGNMFAKMFNNMREKSPLISSLFREVDDNQQATAADALNMGMSLMYGMTLGIPFNLTAPVKNVTSQMPHAQILTGRDTFEMGLVELANPETLKELHQYNVRPEFIMWESPHLGFKGKYTTAIRGLLSLYRASDMLNVYASASAGLVAWRRLESLIDGSGTLKEGISDTVVLDRLFRGETDSRVSEKEVMKHGDKKIFNGVVSKPIALEVLERLKSGKAEDAKRLWLQYNVNFSQWRYGPGGTPGYLRNALWRSTLMFTSWAANDISFMSKTYGQGMEQWMSGHGGSLMWRSTQMLASQLAIMTILYQVGYKYAYNWIAVGPMPDELAGVGPLTGFINLFMKLVTGGAESLTARAIGVSSEDQKKADRKVGSAVDDLLDSFKSPWD